MEHSTETKQMTEATKPVEAKKSVLAAGKYILKVLAKHPTRKYRIGKHLVGQFFQEYDLTAEEAKILSGPEGKWIIIGDEKKLKQDKEHAKILKDLH
jgi:hypothetical protein